MIKKTMKTVSPQLEEIIRVARGEEETDILIKNAKIVDVFSGEVHPDHVAIHGSLIIGLGEYHAKEVIDLKGKYLSPGFIDGHVHIESSMVSVTEFARAVVPLGTTSVVADPHEIANVMGLEGVGYIGESAGSSPFNVYIMLPSCVPATDMETSGARLSSADLLCVLQEDWVLGLGEMMNFPGVIHGVPDLLEKIKIIQGKRIDGHAPLLAGKGLNAYICAGVGSDHECTSLDEAGEKLRKGMYIMIREGTAAKNMEALLPFITQENSRRCMFVTDDRHPLDLLEKGHMDSIIRKAIRLGLHPVTAIQMCSINTAQYFRLDGLGAIAPGYRADISVFTDMNNPRVEMVFKDGKLVAKDGKLIDERKKTKEHILESSIHIKDIDKERLRIRALSGNAVVIELVPDQIVTKKRREKVRVFAGYALPDVGRDILKIAVVERHTMSGNVGLGFVKGFGLRMGAIGSSVAHDSHNIIVVGTNDDDMVKAIMEIKKMGGGQVAVANGNVMESLPLPIAGLMSERSLQEVGNGVKSLLNSTKNLGCKLRDPFMTLSFLALPVVPELKITDKGLVDVNQFKIISLFE